MPEENPRPPRDKKDKRGTLLSAVTLTNNSCQGGIRKGLIDLHVCIEDTSRTSPDYFNITKCEDKFTIGSNGVSFQANARMFAPGSEIQVEVLDAHGNALKHEIKRNTNADARTRTVCFFVCEDTPTGPATLTFTGIAVLDNNCFCPLPAECQDKINVRWSRKIYIDPSLINDEPIDWYEAPIINVEERIVPWSHITVEGQTNTITTAAPTLYHDTSHTGSNHGAVTYEFDPSTDTFATVTLRNPEYLTVYESDGTTQLAGSNIKDPANGFETASLQWVNGTINFHKWNQAAVVTDGGSAAQFILTFIYTALGEGDGLGSLYGKTIILTDTSGTAHTFTIGSSGSFYTILGDLTTAINANANFSASWTYGPGAKDVWITIDQASVGASGNTTVAGTGFALSDVSGVVWVGDGYGQTSAFSGGADAAAATVAYSYGANQNQSVGRGVYPHEINHSSAPAGRRFDVPSGSNLLPASMSTTIRQIVSQNEFLVDPIYQNVEDTQSYSEPIQSIGTREGTGAIPFIIKYEGSEGSITTKDPDTHIAIDQSYASINIRNLKPCCSEVTHVNVYFRSHHKLGYGNDGGFELLNVMRLHPTNFMIDKNTTSYSDVSQTGYGGTQFINFGRFTNQPPLSAQNILNSYWQVGSSDLNEDPIVYLDSSKLVGGVKICHAGPTNTINQSNDTYYTFKPAYSHSLAPGSSSFYSGSTYQIKFSAYAESDQYSTGADNNFELGNPRLDIYMSGSSFRAGYDDKGLGKRITSIESRAANEKYVGNTFVFDPDNDGTGTPVFVLRRGCWTVADIELTAASGSGITPSIMDGDISMPIQPASDVFDFKFEWLNYAFTPAKGTNSISYVFNVPFLGTDLNALAQSHANHPSSSNTTLIFTTSSVSFPTNITNIYSTGSWQHTGSMHVTGTIHATEIIIGVVSKSMLFASGSSKFGDDCDDTHQFTGSVSIAGNLDITDTLCEGGGNISSSYIYARSASIGEISSSIISSSIISSSYILSPHITGSLYGTASWARNTIQCISSSYSTYAVSASWADSASQATTASYVDISGLTVGSASWALTASYVSGGMGRSDIYNIYNTHLTTSHIHNYGDYSGSYIYANSASINNFYSRTSSITNIYNTHFTTSHIKNYGDYSGSYIFANSASFNSASITNLNFTRATGSLFGTASWAGSASQALTASYGRDNDWFKEGKSYIDGNEADPTIDGGIYHEGTVGIGDFSSATPVRQLHITQSLTDYNAKTPPVRINSLHNSPQKNIITYNSASGDVSYTELGCALDLMDKDNCCCHLHADTNIYIFIDRTSMNIISGGAIKTPAILTRWVVTKFEADMRARYPYWKGKIFVGEGTDGPASTTLTSERWLSWMSWPAVGNQNDNGTGTGITGSMMSVKWDATGATDEAAGTYVGSDDFVAHGVSASAYYLENSPISASGKPDTNVIVFALVDETEAGSGKQGKGYHYRQTLQGFGTDPSSAPGTLENDWENHLTTHYKADYGLFVGKAYPSYDCFSGFVYALPNSSGITNAGRQNFALHIYGAIETDVVSPSKFVSFSPTLTGGASNLNAITGSNPYAKGVNTVGANSPWYTGGIFGLASQSISEKHDFPTGIAGWYGNVASPSETNINKSGSWLHGQASMSADFFEMIDGNSIGVRVDGKTVCVNDANELFVVTSSLFDQIKRSTVTSSTIVHFTSSNIINYGPYSGSHIYANSASFYSASITNLNFTRGTGSLFGTASWAGSSSYATTASYVDISGLTVGSASWADSASQAITASYGRDNDWYKQGKSYSDGNEADPTLDGDIYHTGKVGVGDFSTAGIDHQLAVEGTVKLGNNVANEHNITGSIHMKHTNLSILSGSGNFGIGTAKGTGGTAVAFSNSSKHRIQIYDGDTNAVGLQVINWETASAFTAGGGTVGGNELAARGPHASISVNAINSSASYGYGGTRGQAGGSLTYRPDTWEGNTNGNDIGDGGDKDSEGIRLLQEVLHLSTGGNPQGSINIHARGDAGQQIRFFTGNDDTRNTGGKDTETQRMTITHDGGIGIGTHNPQRRLHVSNSVGYNTSHPIVRFETLPTAPDNTNMVVVDSNGDLYQTSKIGTVGGNTTVNDDLTVLGNFSGSHIFANSASINEVSISKTVIIGHMPDPTDTFTNHFISMSAGNISMSGWISSSNTASFGHGKFIDATITNDTRITRDTYIGRNVYVTNAEATVDIEGSIDVNGNTNLDNTDIDGTLVVDGSNISLDSTSTLNIDNSNTTNGITIGTATANVPIKIGHATSTTTVQGGLTIHGTTSGSYGSFTSGSFNTLVIGSGSKPSNYGDMFVGAISMSGNITGSSSATASMGRGTFTRVHTSKVISDNIEVGQDINVTRNINHNGTNINTIYSPIAGGSSIVTVGTITGGTWNGTAIATDYIADNAVTLDKLAGLARGKIIYGNSSGDPAALTVGSNGEVLLSDGTDISWGSAPAATGAQTGITSIKHDSLIIGGNSQNNTIDFGTDDKIIFDIDNVETALIHSTGLNIHGTVSASYGSFTSGSFNTLIVGSGSRPSNYGDVVLTSISASGNISASGDVITNEIKIADKISHKGDGNTKITFADDDINITAGGVNMIDLTQDTVSEITFNEAGADVDIRIESVNDSKAIFINANRNSIQLGSSATTHVTASGNISASGEIITKEVSSIGDFTLDAGGDIILDADGADVILKDGGTEYGRFKRDTSDFIIKSAENNKDIIFRGQDGGSTITALTLDMSEAGSATFNSHITASRTISGSYISMTSGSFNTLIIGSGSKPSNYGDVVLTSISASGNISASGTITTNFLNVKSRVKALGSSLEFSGDTLDFVDATTTSRLFRGIVDGAFEAYYGGQKKIETVAGGVDVTGHVTASGDVSASGDIIGDKIYGDGSTLDDGVNIDRGSDARGDIIYRGASNYVRLAGGSANHVLIMGDADPTWNTVGTNSITDNAVTLAKMAGLARGKIIIGNSSGDPSALAVGSANTVLQSDGTDATWNTIATAMIADNAVTLAKMAGLARGKIIYGDASGDPAALAVGSNGEVLLSDGTDISWGSAPAATGAQTGITSIKHDSLIIGGNSQNNTIDFGTDDKIIFDIDNIETALIHSTGLNVHGTISGSYGSFTSGSFNTLIIGSGSKPSNYGDVVLTSISASGNISASGTITAEHFHSKDDVQIDDDLTVSGKGTFGDLAIETNGSNAILELERNSGAELKLKAQDNQSRITYEGGPLLFDRDESGTNTLTLGTGGNISVGGNISSIGNITSSGDISASGDIIGDKIYGDGSTLDDDVNLDRGSDARGDILYRGASKYQRLAGGSANHVLIMGDADPTWNTVGTNSITDNAVTLAKMAGLARGKIIVGDSSGDPSALSVGGANTVLQSDGTDATWNTIATAMIADDAVDADKLASNAVVNASVASSAAIAFTKLAALTDGNILIGNAGNEATSTTVSGDVTINGSGVTTIGASKVHGTMLNSDVAGTGLTLAGNNLDIEAAQTGITSIKNDSLILGGNSQNNTIDFGTDDKIIFDIDNVETALVHSTGLNVHGTVSGSFGSFTSGSFNTLIVGSGSKPSNYGDMFVGAISMSGNITGSSAATASMGRATFTRVHSSKVVSDNTDISLDMTVGRAIYVAGSNLTAIYSPIAGGSSIVTVGTITGGTWNGTAIATDYIADDAVDGDKIADNAVTLAHMAGLARGKIIYGDASGDPAALAVGTNGYVLTSDGTDISWAESTSATGNITGITSVKHNSLIIGGNSQNNTIDFGTDDKIIFDIDNVETALVHSTGLDVHGTISGSYGSFTSGSFNTLVIGSGSAPANYGDLVLTSLSASGNISASGDLHTFGGVLNVRATDARIRASAIGANHPGFELYEDTTRKWIIYNDPDNSDNLTFKTDTVDYVSIAQTGELRSRGPISGSYLYANSASINEVSISRALIIGHMPDPTDTFTNHFISASAGNISMSGKITANEYYGDGSTLDDGVNIDRGSDARGDIIYRGASNYVRLAKGSANHVLIMGDNDPSWNTVGTNSITDNAVTLAKMAGLARGKIIIGDSSGDPSALAVGSANTVLQSDGTDATWNTIATAMIADNAVSLAKMAGITRGSIIIGDSSGDPSALAVGSANTVLQSDGTDATWNTIATAMIADNAVTLAKMAGLARGKIIYGDSSGDPAALAVGSNGEVLLSDGTDISWGSAPAATGAQTGITSIKHNSLIIGGNSQNNTIDFGTDDKIILDIDNVAKVTVGATETQISGITSGSFASYTSGSFNTLVIGSGSVPSNYGGLTLTEISASGNISSSGTIYASTGSIGRVESAALKGTKIFGSGAHLDDDVNLNRGSDARGDILYRGASDYTRLAGGSANTVLMMGDADPEWNTVGTNNITDNAVTLAKMAGLARGKIIVGDSSGDPAALAVGSANTVLQSDGTDATWNTIATAMIADNAVSLAKMAGLARGKIIIGDSSGDPSALSVGSANTVLQSDGTDATWNTIATAMIADNAVSLAKMAGLARGKIIIGDSSGDPSALSVGSANTVLQSDGTDATWNTIATAMIADDAVDGDKIADNAVTLAHMAGLARGKIIYGDASGDPAALAVGSDGYVLTSDGTDIAWADPGTSLTAGAQTGITTVYNTGLILGRASNDTTINFTTDDKIVLDAGSTEIVEVNTAGVDVSGKLQITDTIASGDDEYTGYGQETVIRPAVAIQFTPYDNTDNGELQTGLFVQNAGNPQYGDDNAAAYFELKGQTVPDAGSTPYNATASIKVAETTNWSGNRNIAGIRMTTENNETGTNQRIYGIVNTVRLKKAYSAGSNEVMRGAHHYVSGTLTSVTNDGTGVAGGGDSSPKFAGVYIQNAWGGAEGPEATNPAENQAYTLFTTSSYGGFGSGKSVFMESVGILNNKPNVIGLTVNGTVSSSRLNVKGNAAITGTTDFLDSATIDADKKLFFRDTNSYINSPTANDIEVAATTITLDAASDIQLEGDTSITGFVSASGVISAAGGVSGSISGDRIYQNNVLNFDAAGEHEGEVVYFGSTDTTAGDLYYLDSSGNWALADADTLVASTGMLAVACGDSSDASGMLIRGFIRSSTALSTRGGKVYLSTTPGDMSEAIGASGDYTRIIGHVVDATHNTLYFNPSNAYVLRS